MTLDEAILHAEEVADTKEKQVERGDWEKGSLTEKSCIACANEHRQLSEWLKDYKRLKEQEPILDRIKSEILEEKECAYADFERYKVEYLGQDWEDAYDSLPQDDFRYGMERAIEIINKHKTEMEG